VAVVRGRDTLVHEGYGMADAERRRPAGPGTVYRVGSVTKQFTAAAVLQLVDEGRLALDDTLGRFLPHYPRWSRVTVRQLLNHTSGIPSYTASARWRARIADDLAPDTLLAFVASDTFDFAPGTRFRYNNTGYFLLGRILERVTGTPYDRYVAERFFGPLGMGSASYCPASPADSTHAAGYDKRGPGETAPAAPLSMTSPYAAGALCMSTGDFLRWQAALTDGRIVRPATFARMSRSDTLTDGRPTNYGWGLAPGRIDDHRTIGHGGDINGFSVQQLWLPDDSLRIVVFANTLGSDPGTLARNVARAALGLAPVAPPRLPPAVALSAAERARYVGRYTLALPDRTLGFTVTERDGRLFGEGEGQGAFALVPLGDHAFGAPFDAATRFVFDVEGERATGFTLRQGGGAFRGTRVP
jgi:CubicO group peptidase (beta-lactamase class C family)